MYVYASNGPASAEPPYWRKINRVWNATETFGNPAVQWMPNFEAVAG